jgi:hypothetical protein
VSGGGARGRTGAVDRLDARAPPARRRYGALVLLAERMALVDHADGPRAPVQDQRLLAVAAALAELTAMGHLTVRDGRFHATRGPQPHPVLTVVADALAGGGRRCRVRVALDRLWLEVDTQVARSLVERGLVRPGRRLGVLARAESTVLRPDLLSSEVRGHLAAIERGPSDAPTAVALHLWLAFGAPPALAAAMEELLARTTREAVESQLLDTVRRTLPQPTAANLEGVLLALAADASHRARVRHLPAGDASDWSGGGGWDD